VEQSQIERDRIIEKVIAGWGANLVNLTGTNRLLNFKVSKSSTVTLAAPGVGKIYERLTQSNRLTIEALSQPPMPVDDGYELPGDAVHQLGSQPWRDPEPRVLATGSLLGADAELAVLGAALRTLMLRSNQTLLDTGLWTLYMSFGILEWADPVNSQTRWRSPLILVPVELHKTGPRSAPFLALSQEDGFVNPALVLKMQGIGLEIPEIDLDEPDAIEGYLAQLEDHVSQTPGWSVARDVYLSYFTFHKEAMYRDLLENMEDILQSEQVRALAGSGLADQPEDFIFERAVDSRIDDLDPPEQASQVLDADSSQRAAIIAAATPGVPYRLCPSTKRALRGSDHRRISPRKATNPEVSGTSGFVADRRTLREVSATGSGAAASATAVRSPDDSTPQRTASPMVPVASSVHRTQPDAGPSCVGRV